MRSRSSMTSRIGSSANGPSNQLSSARVEICRVLADRLAPLRSSRPSDRRRQRLGDGVEDRHRVVARERRRPARGCVRRLTTRAARLDLPSAPMPWTSTPAVPSRNARSTAWIARRRPTNSARLATGISCRACRETRAPAPASVRVLAAIDQRAAALRGRDRRGRDASGRNRGPARALCASPHGGRRRRRRGHSVPGGQLLRRNAARIRWRRRRRPSRPSRRRSATCATRRA